jgi:hypothetical protein
MPPSWTVSVIPPGLGDADVIFPTVSMIPVNIRKRVKGKGRKYKVKVNRRQHVKLSCPFRASQG